MIIKKEKNENKRWKFRGNGLKKGSYRNFTADILDHCDGLSCRIESVAL